MPQLVFLDLSENRLEFFEGKPVNRFPTQRLHRYDQLGLQLDKVAQADSNIEFVDGARYQK